MKQSPVADSALTLNIRAMVALRGVGKDWRADILALLESDAPIERMFRAQLAKAIRGDDPSGIKLTMRGHKKARDASVGAIVRFEYMELGRWIEARISSGQARHSSLSAAAAQFNASVESCEEALIYYQRASRWLELAQGTELGLQWPRDILESMYHARNGGSQYVVGLNRKAFEIFDAAYHTATGISGAPE